MKHVRTILGAALALALAACASVPPARVALPAPAQWHAPLPHEGKLANLTGWWRQQGARSWSR